MHVNVLFVPPGLAGQSPEVPESLGPEALPLCPEGSAQAPTGSHWALGWQPPLQDLQDRIQCLQNHHTPEGQGWICLSLEDMARQEVSSKSRVDLGTRPAQVTGRSGSVVTVDSPRIELVGSDSSAIFTLLSLFVGKSPSPIREGLGGFHTELLPQLCVFFETVFH